MPICYFANFQLVKLYSQIDIEKLGWSIQCFTIIRSSSATLANIVNFLPREVNCWTTLECTQFTILNVTFTSKNQHFIFLTSEIPVNICTFLTFSLGILAKFEVTSFSNFNFTFLLFWKYFVPFCILFPCFHIFFSYLVQCNIHSPLSGNTYAEGSHLNKNQVLLSSKL